MYTSLSGPHELVAMPAAELVVAVVTAIVLWIVVCAVTMGLLAPSVADDITAEWVGDEVALPLGGLRNLELKIGKILLNTRPQVLKNYTHGRHKIEDNKI